MTETTKATHTPGPWKIDTFHYGEADKRRPHACIAVHPDSPGRGWICDMDEGKDGTPEGEANAHLIAAAPDLLAACNLALRHVPADAMEYSEGTHGERVYVADAIRAAIARAEGGAR